MNMPTYTELQDKVNALEKKIVTLEQTDQELHDLTDKYWQLFNHSGALVIVVDTDGIIINLNDAAAINIGSARGAVIGKTLHELFPEKAWEYIKRLRQVFASGKEKHFEDVFAVNGERKWFRTTLSPLKNNDGALFAVQAVFYDITESKLAEDELRQKGECFKKLFELSSDGIVIHTLTADVLEVNDRMLEISGYGRDEFTRDCLKGFDNGRDGRFIETVFNRLAEKKYVQFISDYKRPDNRIVTVDTRISVIDKNKGLAQSVVRDITHRKQTEGDLFSKKKQAGELKETNADVLLADRENDKKTMQDSILSNMKDMIFPYLEKLENSPLSELQKLYVRTIKNNICDITNPFINRLSSKFTPLTPMEIRVARLVKDGKTTKEIAELLSSTRGTIEFHRNNLRKKLGIRNSGTNLRAFLMSVK